MGEEQNLLWYVERKHVATPEQPQGVTRWAVWFKEPDNEFYYCLEYLYTKQHAVSYAKYVCRRIANNKRKGWTETIQTYFTDDRRRAWLLSCWITEDFEKQKTKTKKSDKVSSQAIARNAE